MKGKRRRQLHESPPEFQQARETQAKRLAWEQRACDYSIRKREEMVKREKVRNMKMPSHPAPSPRCVGWGMGKPEFYESEAAFQRRYEKWAKRFRKNDSHGSSST